METITVENLGGREFRVSVAGGGHETLHRVTVPVDFTEGLDVGDDDLELVVRESFGFLLEREPASAILPRFSLDQISRYFHDYRHELARRLQDGANG